MRLATGFAVLIAALGFLNNPGVASAEIEVYTIVIKDHKFSPAELTIPAQKKVKIIVENHDPTAEEFESDELRREKIVPANGKITIFIGPLPPGTYKYIGEFHKDTAQGVIIVK